MKISIITPSLCRPSLRDCCHSVDIQLGAEWQHIVCFDLPESEIDSDLMFSLAHPCRTFLSTGQRYGHYGNHARWLAWEKATGAYCCFLDDDNTLARPDALADISACLVRDHFPDFAIFPIHRHGSVFFHVPPRMCFTDSANLCVKTKIGRWPDIEMREADGYFADQLTSSYAYSAFPDVEPVIRMERSSNGV
ncbi:MAG: glycosyltransferase family 2 protein [Patescibacteria group bacterium]|nr:glycosyltransferase family 2 protein [Patescibacteria group bacterium]